EWRFTPLRRLRGLHSSPALPLAKVAVEVDGAPEVTDYRAERGDLDHAVPFEPVDRVSAEAFGSFQEAVVVKVPAEVITSRPTVISVRGDDASGAAFGHTVIDVGDNARAVVVVDHRGSATYADNVEIIVGEGAGLTLVSVQDWADDAVHVSHHQATLGRDSRLQHAVVTLGGNVVRGSPAGRFAGPRRGAGLLPGCFPPAGQPPGHPPFLHPAQPDRPRPADSKVAPP